MSQKNFVICHGFFYSVSVLENFPDCNSSQTPACHCFPHAIVSRILPHTIASRILPHNNLSRILPYTRVSRIPMFFTSSRISMFPASSRISMKERMIDFLVTFCGKYSRTNYRKCQRKLSANLFTLL